MSVFQLQEWWGVKVAQNEEFDHGSLVVGNLDNADPPANKIAVGSQQGMLRIYAPTRPQFRVEDLILEESLGQPILQLLAGCFIPSTKILGLAVLHPKQLAVYEVVAQANKDGRVNFYALRKAYVHDLGMGGHFTAYNMTSGCFGGVSRDLIAVQSLDGKLQIFEQSANAFTRQIADCLLPGPVAYVPKIDAFVTVNHACTAECYRYQVLANSSGGAESGAKADGGGPGEGKSGVGFGYSIRPAMVEWSLHVSEPCRQVLEGFFSAPSDAASRGPRPSELLLLCDKSLFLLKGDTGALMQQRRLDDASCMCAVPSAGGGSSNFILAGQDATLQVYSGFNLVWAAKVPSVPVQMAVASLGEQRGLIVSLDEEGHLSACYLGTKPPVNSVMQQVRELDYDMVESEHRSLLQVIRDSQSETRVEATDRLFLRPQFPKGVETADQPSGAVRLPPSLVPLFGSLGGAGAAQASFGGPCIKMLLRLYLSYSSAEHPATNVSLVVDAPPFAHVVPKNVILQRVSGVKSTPLMVKLFFYATSMQLCPSLQAVITATYVSHTGEPRVTSLPLQLPLFLACRPRAPVKTALCKVVLDTPHAAQPLTALFGDFLYAYQVSGMDVSEAVGSNAVQAMGFQLFAPNPPNPPNPTTLSNTSGSPDKSSAGTGAGMPAAVSILVSKNAGRYRIQADSFAAMSLLLEELDRRLNERLAEGGESKTAGPAGPAGAGAGAGNDSTSCVTCDDPLPVEAYLALVQAHLDVRQRIQELTAQLNDVAHQYRMVQKRLLVRFKDRNPTPLGGLDQLVADTYRKIIQISDDIEEQQKRQRCLRVELECFSRFLGTMAGLKYRLTRGETQQLRTYLNPNLLEGSEQGWEEVVDASLMYLLKTSLAKSTKEAASLAGTTLQLPPSLDSLSKHLVLLFDRLENGGRLNATLANSGKTAGIVGSQSSSRK